ncbi:MAG: hypothetical protein V4555_08220 [Acidobacteriota bacterium]
MERFSAAAFQQIVTGLVFLVQRIEDLPADLEAGDLASKYIPTVTMLRTECQKLGLRTSISCANDFITLSDGMTIRELTQTLRELDNTIRREMQAELFFHVPYFQAAYYERAHLFGAKVAVKFPGMEYDIREAGNCYAASRSTACVFHLMRVMEMAVQVFGRKLGVEFTDTKDWHNIVEQTAKAVQALSGKAQETATLSQVAAHLYAVKKAWRNRVMHPHERYSMDEAKDLLSHVEAFMKALAELKLPAVP